MKITVVTWSRFLFVIVVIRVIDFSITSIHQQREMWRLSTSLFISTWPSYYHGNTLRLICSMLKVGICWCGLSGTLENMQRSTKLSTFKSKCRKLSADGKQSISCGEEGAWGKTHGVFYLKLINTTQLTQTVVLSSTKQAAFFPH